MTYQITLIPGDGIGPDVTDAVVRILQVAGVDIEAGLERRPQPSNLVI